VEKIALKVEFNHKRTGRKGLYKEDFEAGTGNTFPNPLVEK
jgi:hypothetical protein